MSVTIRGRFLALLATALLFPAAVCGAANRDEARRVLLGLHFFPNVLSVDQDLLGKQTPDGKLRLLLLYKDLPVAAEKLAASLREEVRSIQKIPVEVVVVDDADGAFAGAGRPCGVFLAEALPDADFKRVLRLAAANRVIVFSPFEGDVERGATAGLHVSSKIRPALNLTTLRKSLIRIHEMFMRLAKLYE